MQESTYHGTLGPVAKGAGMLDDLVDSTETVIFAKDVDGRYIFINRGYELAHAVSRTTYLGKTDYDLFPKETADAYREADRKVLETRSPYVSEERYGYHDGYHAVVVVKFPLVDKTGELYAVCGIATDVTQRTQAEARMRMLSAAVDQASDMVAMFEWTPLREWRIAYVNETFLKTTGYERSDVIGHTSRFLEGPRTNVEESNRRRALLAQGIPSRHEVAYYRHDGSIFWVELNARPLRGPDGSVTHTIVMYRDTTARHEQEELQSLETARDDITGLHNARYLTRALDYAIHDARMNDRPHGLLAIEFAGFSDISKLSEVLGHRLRSADVMARTGPQELAVLLRHCNLEQARRAADEFLAAIERLHVQSDIGVAEITTAATGAQEVLQMAQAACARAKLEGPNRVAVAV